MYLNVNELVQAQLSHKAPPVGSRHLLRRILGECLKMRFQVLFGLLATMALPTLIRRGWEALGDFRLLSEPSVIGNVLAYLLGFYIYRKVASFPGVRATSSIIPAFTASYGVVALLFLVLRLDYRVGELALSFLIAVSFFYVTAFLIRRVRRVAMAVIPGGQAEALLAVPMIDWHLMHAPDQPVGGLPIVADFRHDFDEPWLRLVTQRALAGRDVYNSKQVFESLTGRVQIDHISENVFGTLRPNEMWSSAKRYCDSLAAFVALIGASWLMALVAMLIRLESRGPAIFRQQRIGMGARPFTIYKFRTMRMLTPKEEATNTHAHDVDRITPLGRFLRRSRLDELPQLFNILKGEMSWIGPRPEALSLSATYAEHLPFYHYRHVVRPGITGWAQVNQGHVVGIEDADLKLQYDFFYIKNFSLWLDILVCLRTLRVILFGTGAR